jgi:hypothetical protein
MLRAAEDATATKATIPMFGQDTPPRLYRLGIESRN